MNRSLEDIYHSALKFLVPLTPEKTFETVVSEAIKLVNGKEGSIFLAQNGEFIRVYTTNKKLNDVIPRKKGFTIRTLQKGKSHLRHKESLQKAHSAFRSIPVGSDITIPLSYENKSIGVLSILSKKNKRFTKKELKILDLFAPLAMLAIRKTQLYDLSQKALDTRDLFISMASHELKTPLTTINLYTQLIRDKIIQGKLPNAKWVDTLSWEVLRLTLLVNELLGIDQVKAEKLQYNWKECSLKEIVNKALVDFQHTHTDRKIEFVDSVKENSDIIKADYDKVLEIILNLLSNAAKFSPATLPIKVELKKRNARVFITISDQGKGIAKDDLPHIFDRFYKGHDITKAGMGLGLYLTKKIVDEHQGKIQIQSNIEKGTRMEIAFPRTS